MNHDAQLVPIESLKPYKGNPRRGNIDLIRESLKKNGQYRPVVVRTKTRQVLAGNHTLLAAQAEGMEQLWATFIDCDARTAKRIVLVDNRTNDLAGYDTTELAELLGSLPDLEGTGYTQTDLQALLPPATTGDTEPGEVPAEPRTKMGDLIMLGDHRLLCGDAFNETDLQQVTSDERPDALISDPPYGIGIVRNGTASNFPGTYAPRHQARPIVGDDDKFEPQALLTYADKIVLWGANHFAGRLPCESRWLVWDKKDGAFRGSDLGDCELAWTNLGGAARLLHHTWQGMFRAGEGERAARVHPTQKPVDLMAWCVEQIGDAQSILDPFAGSGSTLIACENLNRRCYAIEIDPGYCDVIVDRWERHTGKKAQLATDKSDT